jgi:hypothetical protein
MARRYKRDARGRFAGGNGSAPKRLAFLRVYHGTTRKAAAAIRAGGYKESETGQAGRGVYTSRKRKIADKYAGDNAGYRDDGKRITRKGAVLTHRVFKGKVAKVSAPKQESSRGEFSRSTRQIQKVVRARMAASLDDKYSVVLMNRKMADRTLVKSQGTVRASRRRK